MSLRLRQEAHNSGWPEHLVNSMHVSYDGKNVATHMHQDHHQEAMDYEYGTPDRRPTAAVRRFNNRKKETESFLLKRLNHHLKGII